jgi:hypothetical protein
MITRIFRTTNNMISVEQTTYDNLAFGACKHCGKSFSQHKQGGSCPMRTDEMDWAIQQLNQSGKDAIDLDPFEYGRILEDLNRTLHAAK